jgi:threonine dehydrogenase-like Zn-dependent dehydrogenase
MFMQVAMLYGPEDVRFESVPVPQPGPGEVLVRVKVALTDGADAKTFKRGGHIMLGGKMPSPFGHEFAGVVEKVGHGVTKVRKGGLAVMFGGAPHGTTMSVDTRFMHYGEVTVKGVFHHTPRYVKDAIELIAHERIDIDTLVSETMPLSRLPDAISGMTNRAAFKYALIPGR